jgi:NADH-quinone oxidoreductase subunit A
MMIENALIISFVLLVCIILDIALILLSAILPRYHPSDVKQSRWEAGNLPIKYPKYTLPMQYLGFMFMFMAAEPILVILLLLAAYPAVNYYIVLLLALLLLLPAIYVGYKVSLEMAYRSISKSKDKEERN